MAVRMIEVGEPQREHEIERTTQPMTVPEPRKVELPDPAVTPTPTPVKVPA